MPNLEDILTEQELEAIANGREDDLPEETLIKIANLPPEPNTASQGTEKKEGVGSYLANLLGTYGNAATAGLVNPVAAGASALIDEGLQLGGVTPERSIGESYKYFNKKQKERLGEFQKENPGTTLLTDIAGVISPGGVASRSTALGKGLVKGSGLAKKLPFLQNLLGGGLGNAAFGQVAAEGDTPLGDRAEDALKDFILGGAFEGVGDLFAKAPAGAEKVGSRLYNSILKRPKKVIIEEGKKGKDLAKELYDRGLIGGLKRLGNKADEGLSKSEETLQKLLNASDGAVPQSKVIDEIAGLKSNYEGVLDSSDELAKIDEVVKSLDGAESIPIAEANKVKRRIYDLIQNRGYKGSNPLPVKTDIKKAQARGLKKGIEEVVPEAAGLNKELSVFGRLKDAIEDQSASGQRGNLVKTLSLLGSGALGAGVGFGSKDPTLGALATLGALSFGTPLGKTLSAQTLKQLSSLLPKTQQGVRELGPVITYLTSKPQTQQQ